MDSSRNSESKDQRLFLMLNTTLAVEKAISVSTAHGWITLPCNFSLILEYLYSYNLDKVISLIANNHWALHLLNHVFARDFRNFVCDIPLHHNDHITWDGNLANFTRMCTIRNSFRRVGIGPRWLTMVLTLFFHSQMFFCAITHTQEQVPH